MRRDISDSFLQHWHEMADFEGGLWLALIDGLLLVPLVFSAFFYPAVAFSISGAVIGITGVGAWWWAKRRGRSQSVRAVKGRNRDESCSDGWTGRPPLSSSWSPA